MFANEGTPFYVALFISIFIGGFGVCLERVKKEAPTKLFNQSLLNHFGTFAFFAASLSSEMIIAVSILTSSVSSLKPYATLLLLSRLLGQILPVLFFIFDFIRPGSIFKPLLDTKTVFSSSRPFGVLIFLSMFECSLLTYLPWVKSDFTDLSGGFPNVLLFRSCLVFQTLRLALTFIAQVGIFVETGISADSFAIFLWINIAQLAVFFVVYILQGFLKWGVLSESTLEDDSDAGDSSLSEV